LDVGEGDVRGRIDPRWELRLLLEAYAVVHQYLPHFEKFLSLQSCGVPPHAYGRYGATSHEVAWELATAVLEAVASVLGSELMVRPGPHGAYVADVLGWEWLLTNAAFARPLHIGQRAKPKRPIVSVRPR
jgi:hypothetical protein